jgi:hypothetical protein
MLFLYYLPYFSFINVTVHPSRKKGGGQRTKRGY